MACVECRQQKSRCDAHQRIPCSRCSKKGLQCNLKSDYKRTDKRARIAQIEKEFSILKNTLTNVQAKELLLKVPSLVGTNFASTQFPPPVGQPQSHQPLANYASNDWPVSVSPHPGNHTLHSNSTSEANNSLPNTPSIQKLMNPPAQNELPAAASNSYNSGLNNHNGNNENGININNNIPEGMYHPDSKIILTDELLACEEKSIDSVTISSETIKALYIEYVEYYHVILPVVDIKRGPESIYRLCPALFWVMMFVSLRRFPEDHDKAMLIKLSPIVKDILAEISISPITRYNPTEEDEPILNASSVFSVQAFLLYTFWPPITSSLSADSSWNTIGAALFQAIRIGLHTSLATNPDTKLDKAQENTRTWICCNIVSQTIATSFGFPAFVQFDSSVWSAFRPESPIQLPKSIKYMMEIAHFEDQVGKTLNTNPLDPYGLADPTERLPLLKVLLRQLDELEIKIAKYDLSLSSDQNGLRKFQLLSARISLLTYYFMDSSRIANFELQKGLVQVYNAAVGLVSHAQLCQAKDKKFVKYLPGVYILNIWQASCIIGKLAHSPLKNVIDLGSGKQSYQAAITLAAKASILKHDMAHRSSGIMRNMWQLFRTLDAKKLTGLSITIRTRMSASVFFDCLFLLREQVGMIKLNSKSKNENSGSNNDNANSNDLTAGDNPKRSGTTSGSVSDDDDDDYDNDDRDSSNEEVIASDDNNEDEIKKDGEGSSHTTPGSNTSSKTKKQRSLSNTMNAESKARKIIRTIPLDPQPITAQRGKRLSIFNVVNQTPLSESLYGVNRSPDTFRDPNSPAIKKTPISNQRQTSNPQQNPQYQPPNQHVLQTRTQASAAGHNNPQYHPPFSSQEPFKQFQSVPNSFQTTPTNNPDSNNMSNATLTEMVLNESPLQGGLEGLEFNGMDISTDLLWKDVDSVMNDFGFHT